MHIEQWMTSPDVVTLPVHHARLRIRFNGTCDVLLASFDDPECSEYLTPPSQDTGIITSTVGDNYIITNNSECLIPDSKPTVAEKDTAAAAKAAVGRLKAAVGRQRAAHRLRPAAAAQPRPPKSV